MTHAIILMLGANALSFGFGFLAGRLTAPELPQPYREPMPDQRARVAEGSDNVFELRNWK
jgi:hypothetical protein